MPERKRLANATNTYSSWVGSVYIFNLIVGTGALTIPAAFGRAGWLLGTLVMVALAFLSYMTATFTIEAMAAANAIIQWKKLRHHLVVQSGESEVLQQEVQENEGGLKVVGSGAEVTPEEEEPGAVEEEPRAVEEEQVPLLESCDVNEDIYITPTDYYSIQNKVEMGEMATMFFNKAGLILFYVIISVYLYGDLAIYGAAISKTLRDITCTHFDQNVTCDPGLAPASPCWPSVPINRSNAYRLYLAAFVLLVGPFVFSNVQKTKALQIFTTLLRWTAFVLMVVLASLHLSRHGSVEPAPFRASGLPGLFGVCVYSFMCHHSLPSLVTPIADKSRLSRAMALNYAAILLFYLLVALTAVFSFGHLEDLYTLNFKPDQCRGGGGHGEAPPTHSPVIQYFLSLFPVFTLTTNYPVIGITLRNNLSQAAAIVFGNKEEKKKNKKK